MKKNEFNKTKKIAVVTGTRAEYGILKPLLKAINQRENLELKLLVAGMHLLKTHGLTIKEIEKDGFKIDKKVQMYDDDLVDSAKYHSRALAKGVVNFTETLFELKPDVLVILGDRLEALAAVLAATYLNLPIAHIHGGDKTNSGHVDESIRHSISKFAHIHFPPTEQSAERLKKMGEESRRIFQVGALGLDSIIDQPTLDKNVLFQKLGLDLKQKTIVLLFHPVHLEIKTMSQQMQEIVSALKELKIQTVVLYPNNDSGSQMIIREIEKLRDISFFKIFQNLFHSEYISLLKHADVLIGNSSSGIVEASVLKLAVVNIGSRNTGREHGKNVIFVKSKKIEIIKAIKKSLYDQRFKKRVRKEENFFGDGRTAVKIAGILSKMAINPELLQKKITY